MKHVFTTLSGISKSATCTTTPRTGNPQCPDHPETKSETNESLRKGLFDQGNALDAAKADVGVDHASIQPGYANFCRVTATPEEVILDFGLNQQPFAPGTEPVKISQRTVVNFYTAKRVLIALETTVRRHGETFGTIELEVRRRTKTFHEQQQQKGNVRKN